MYVAHFGTVAWFWDGKDATGPLYLHDLPRIMQGVVDLGAWNSDVGGLRWSPHVSTRSHSYGTWVFSHEISLP